MKLQPYLERLEALSVREICLIGATVVGFLVSVLQFLLIDPMLTKHMLLQSRLKAANTNIQRQQRQLDTDAPMQSRLLVLQAEIKNLEQGVERRNEHIDEYASTLVPARRMPALLQSLLEDKSVSLVSLVNLPPVSLLKSPAGGEQDSQGFQLYKHGIQLQLRGDFHTLRRYLVAIEQQPWKLIWQSVRFETDKNGSNVMELHLQTLSTESAWLGV